MTRYTLRALETRDRPVTAPILEREWGGVEVVALSLGRMVDASTLPGLIAEQDGQVVGLLTYLVAGQDVELVTINAFAGGGIGTALLARLIEEVRGVGATRIRLTTTNDNTRALRFYQRAGFVFTALHPGAVAEARKLKPRIPEFGHDGIPIRDELELEFRFS